MTVYVIIGIWSGCIEHVTAWSDKGEADKEAERMKKDWGSSQATKPSISTSLTCTNYR